MCRFFVPDPIGDGQGIATCLRLEQFMKKQRTNSELRRYLLALGNNPDVSYVTGGLLIDRDCKRYEALAIIDGAKS